VHVLQMLKSVGLMRTFLPIIVGEETGKTKFSLGNQIDT
jgi:hypothetical protein